MKAKEIEDLIISHCEGATDNVADGVRYKILANTLALMFDKIQPTIINKRTTCFDLYHNIPDAEKSICPICKQWTK